MKIFSSVNSTAGQNTVEKLKLKAIGTELVITSSHKGTKENKGPGGPVADIFGYDVTYEGKSIISFDVNNATGDVITSTVKIQSEDLTAEFFSALFSSLSMGGVKSLGKSNTTAKPIVWTVEIHCNKTQKDLAKIESEIEYAVKDATDETYEVISIDTHRGKGHVLIQGDENGAKPDLDAIESLLEERLNLGIIDISHYSNR